MGSICSTKKSTQDVRSIIQINEKPAAIDNISDLSFQKEKPDLANTSIDKTEKTDKKAKEMDKSITTDKKSVREDAIPKHFLEEYNPKFEVEKSDTNVEESMLQNNDMIRTKNQKKKFIPKASIFVKDKSHKYENYQILTKKKSPHDIIFLITALKQHFLFSNLSDVELEVIVKDMKYCGVIQNEFLFKQGDDGYNSFVIEVGELEVTVNEKVVRTLGAGLFFGELALLYSAPRSASIKAIINTRMWAIDRHSFQKAVQEINKQKYDENRKFIDSIAFFDKLTTEQKDAIALGLIQQKFQEGQTIVNEGDQASSFYIIMDGEISIMKKSTVVRKLYSGDSFGEQALYNTNSVRAMSVVANKLSRLLALSRHTIKQILGEQVQVIVFKNSMRWSFEKDEYLSKMTKIQKEKVLDSIRFINCNDKDVVIPVNQKEVKIYVALEGNMIYEKSGKSFLIKGASWGSEIIFKNEAMPNFGENIIMSSIGVYAEITKSKLEDLINGNFADILKKNETTHEKRLFMQDQTKRNEAQVVDFNNLILLMTLGRGQFGHVILVKSKANNQYYALKCISQSIISEYNLTKYLEMEKKVMENITFPFCIYYMKQLSDEKNIFFLLEYIKGLELFDVIREIGLLNSQTSKFYIGTLILIFEYLHGQNIIYRDLKPENILVDEQGYVKLIDMGTAKYLTSTHFAAARTFTLIGTPHYMAPEIIAGKGYNYLVDLWSLGILIFEFMVGYVPFGEEASDPYAIYEDIIKSKELKFPDYVKDKSGKKMMTQLLSKVPETRLGNNYASLKANPWFHKFDWVCNLFFN